MLVSVCAQRNPPVEIDSCRVTARCCPSESCTSLSSPISVSRSTQPNSDPNRNSYHRPHFTLTQVSKFLFGDGFAVAGGDNWRVRRKAVGPALHRAYLETMIERVFAPSGVHLNTKLQVLPQDPAPRSQCGCHRDDRQPTNPYKHNAVEELGLQPTNCCESNAVVELNMMTQVAWSNLLSF